MDLFRVYCIGRKPKGHQKMPVTIYAVAADTAEEACDRVRQLRGETGDQFVASRATDRLATIRKLAETQAAVDEIVQFADYRHKTCANLA